MQKDLLNRVGRLGTGSRVEFRINAAPQFAQSRQNDQNRYDLHKDARKQRAYIIECEFRARYPVSWPLKDSIPDIKFRRAPRL